MNCAHFFTKTRNKPAEVIITVGPSLTSGTVFQSYVSGKREAAKYAAENNAKHWNF